MMMRIICSSRGAAVTSRFFDQVEATRPLVHQQDDRPTIECARKEEPLPLTARFLNHRPMCCNSASP